MGDEPTAPAAPGQERPRPRWGLFGGLAATIVVLDQLTKAWLVASLLPGQRVEVVGSFVRLVHGQNSGAIFGLFRDSAPLFALASLAVVGLIVWYELRSGHHLVVSVALGLLLGGALGNLVDRLRWGYVVDFVDIGIGDLRWYTFNVADAAVSTALVLLVFLALWPEARSGGPAVDGEPPLAGGGREVGEGRPGGANEHHG